MIDQKLTVHEIYSMCLNKNCNFKNVQNKWLADRLELDWISLTYNARFIINGSLKNFFIMFNA